MNRTQNATKSAPSKTSFGKALQAEKELTKLLFADMMSRKAGKVSQRTAAPPVKPSNGRVAGAAQKKVNFGPVSTIDTAPVSIGNTIRGSTPIVTPIANGERVRGRDFLTTIDTINNASSTWTVAGGAPITPSCMTTSVLKQLSNTYSEYCVHAVAFHFITAANTSTPGSVMMYISKSRAAPGVITSSGNLLPFVLSDDCTVITPVWQNASAVFTPVPTWYSTNLGNDEGLHEQACGELFVLTKSNSTNGPGYIIMDYDMSFRVKQVNIKSSVFPLSRMKYTQISLEHTGSNLVAHNTAVQLNVAGALLDGTTASAQPSGYLIGDVYKMVLNATNSTYNGTALPASFLSVSLGDSIFSDLSVTDGFTCYGVIQSSTGWKLFPTYEGAFVNSNPYTFGVTGTAPTVQLYWYVSLVGTVGSTTIQQASY